MTTTRSLIPLALLLVIGGAIALMVITNHAAERGAEQYWSAVRILDRYQRGGGKDCLRLEIAVCPPREGTEGFTVRAYCEPQDYPGSGIMGIWGWNQQGVYITGYRIEYARWVSTCARDGCVEADITMLQRVLR